MKASPPKPEQWLYTRAQTALLLGISTDQVKALERDGKLTKVKLTDKPHSMAYYRRQEIAGLAQFEEAFGA